MEKSTSTRCAMTFNPNSQDVITHNLVTFHLVRMSLILVKTVEQKLSVLLLEISTALA